jgi:hypothetical protein
VSRVYEYVGSRRIAELADAPIERLALRSPDDVRTSRLAPKRGALELTYIVDTDGQLWLSDRHGEHVSCARGRAVLAAGEIVLAITEDAVLVESVSNQSTGYCPEPACWAAVDRALRACGLSPPPAFTHAFEFRRCTECGQINLLKESMPECASCEAELPAEWNF